MIAPFRAYDLQEIPFFEGIRTCPEVSEEKESCIYVHMYTWKLPIQLVWNVQGLTATTPNAVPEMLGLACWLSMLVLSSHCGSALRISKFHQKTEVLADISRSKDANATLQTAIRIHMFREQKFIHRLQHVTVFLQLPLQIHTGVGGIGRRFSSPRKMSLPPEPHKNLRLDPQTLNANSQTSPQQT